MKKNIKKFIIKMICAGLGGGLITLGLVNLVIIFFVLKNFSIKVILTQSLFIKSLTLIKIFFYIYFIIVGIAVYREIKWAARSVIPLPFLFILIDYLSKTERTFFSYLLWLFFLFFLVIFYNIKNARHFPT